MALVLIYIAKGSGSNRTDTKWVPEFQNGAGVDLYGEGKRE